MRRAREEAIGNDPRKGGLNTKSRIWLRMRMACRSGLLSHGGATADCARAIAPIDGFAAERLSADKGRDTDETLARAEKQGMEAVIPPKKSRRERRDCDREPCRARCLMENAFPHLKRWRGIATRHTKNAVSFLVVIQIGCIFLWASIS